MLAMSASFTTTTGPTAVDLATHHLGFDWGGTVRAHEQRGAGHDADWRLALFHGDTDADVHADHWERHPEGDEAVCCLGGALRLHLRADRPAAPDEVVRLLPGQGTIVPRNRWHRVELDEPSDLLVVTTRRGTQRERRVEPPGRSR